MPEMDARLIPKNNAQVAHNCELTDGKIRAMPEWIPLPGLGRYDRADSVVFNPTKDKVEWYEGYICPTILNGPPFATGVTVMVEKPNNWGDSTPINYYDGVATSNAAVRGDVSSVNVSYQRSYDSNKPVNRLYAVSAVRKYNGTADEGPLYVLPGQTPKDVVYEGDLVTISLWMSTAYGATHLRLYRTITGMDTGEVITNELDTEWHLVTEAKVGQFNYVDGDSATALPLDVYHAGRFQSLDDEFTANYVGLTEDGYFVAVDWVKGRIAISERYKFHAWPLENYFTIPEPIVDCKVHENNLYLGTKTRPYIMAITQGESAVQAAIRPYQDVLLCLPQTMTVAPGGVLYASQEGIVSLTRDGAKVITSETLRPNTELITSDWTDDNHWPPKKGTLRVSVKNSVFGFYDGGKYYGVVAPPKPEQADS